MACSIGMILFFFQAEDGIRDLTVTGVQTCALPISPPRDDPSRHLRHVGAVLRLPDRAFRGRVSAVALPRAGARAADRGHAASGGTGRAAPARGGGAPRGGGRARRNAGLQNPRPGEAQRSLPGGCGGAPGPRPRLGALVIREAVRRAGIDPAAVEEVIMGNVLQGGVGQAPARQAAIHAGLPGIIPALTVNKVCGSGLKAVMLAAQAIKAGDEQCIVAGGMESMSNAPHYVFGMRAGIKVGNSQLVDGMIRSEERRVGKE